MRHIIHLDADAFFASVEQAADPRLRGKPIAVGGEKRGIIASASYEARKFGIYTPMPSARARKLCPKLILLPGDFEKYEQFSRWMFSYAYDFTPDVEIGSIDEGYFDMTGARKPAVEVADTIRNAIRQALKITVSEGIGSNKLVSQIASKLNKPAAFFHVPAGNEISFLHPLPNKWLPGVGPKTSVRLSTAGLVYVRQVAAMPADLLSLLVGSAAPQLKNFANGIDERPIVPMSQPAKSYGHQETFAEDQTDEEFIDATLRRMADRLMAKVREEDKAIRTLTVKVRYNDMDERQCSESLLEPTDLETDIYSRLYALLRRAWERRVSLRMVSLRLSNVYDSFFRTELPLEINARQREAQRRLAATIDELRRTHGRGAILRGHDFVLVERKAAREEKKKGKTRRYKITVVSRPQKPTLTANANRRTRPASSKSDAAPSRPKAMDQSDSETIRGNSELDAASPLTPTLSPHEGERAFKPRSIPREEARFKIQNRQSLLTSAATVQEDKALEGRQTTVRIPHSATAFTPLAARSYYSFLDSTLSPKAIVELAKHHDLPTVALCDQGNLHGAVEFVQEARKAGIKPILGAELRVAGTPLRLYVQNAKGYANLCRLLSTHGEKHRPRHLSFVLENKPQTTEDKDAGWGRARAGSEVGEDFLASAAEGLLAVSPDARLAEWFPGRFYQAITLPDELRRLGESRLPRVAMSPVHYAVPADRWKYDIVQSIRTLTLLRQAHPEKDFTSELHFRTPREMNELFREHPELLDHTREIADRCTFELPFGKPQFPAFRPPDGSSAHGFLRKLVMAGFQKRYDPLRISNLKSQISNLKSQIETELNIIAEVGYEEYFLVVWDVLQACRKHGIEWITRGSAADSLVCYCLGISDVCPVRFGLYFRRFLNKERMALHKLPDIDVDFPHDRKDDVIDLVFEKYGAVHCAVVGGFSTFKARSAFAEVAKVMGVAEREARKFTERFPWRFGSAFAASSSSFVLEKDRHLIEQEDEGHRTIKNRLADSLCANPELRDLPLDEEPYRSALIMAEFLDGFPRYPKMHPCGLVLSRQPMHELTPTFVSQKGYPTTHFDMDAVEAIGLVKMDILAQGGLAVMRDVKEALARREIEIDLRELSARNGGASGRWNEWIIPPARELWREFPLSSASTKRAQISEAQGLPSPPHEPRSRRGEQAHSYSAKRRSLLTPAATVQGFRTRTASENSLPEGEGQGEGKENINLSNVSSQPYPIPSSHFVLNEALDEPGRAELPLRLTREDENEGRGRGRTRLCLNPQSAVRSPQTDEPWMDPAVWEWIACGNARAVHHIESPAMISLCRMCNVRDIDTLIAIVSVIRPGAANEDRKREFTRRYQGLSPITYPHPSLEPCLKDSFGLLIYEEQLLQICEAFAGLPAGRADGLRRALGKEKLEVVAEVAKEFVACARARNRTEADIERVWGMVSGFLGYTFCKAHSAAYGVEAYQSAWLKRYFPAEFMAAVLTNGKGFYRPLVYVLECWRLGIGLLPPWVNEPGPGFRVKAEGWENLQLPPPAHEDPARRQFMGSGNPLSHSKIRAPVGYIKGLTDRTKERILAEREQGEFTSLADFYRRALPAPEEMELLIRAGALDGFGKNRTAQYWDFRLLSQTFGDAKEPGQGWLLPPVGMERLPEAPLNEPTHHQRLEWEYELLGFPASAHPLELHNDIAWETYCPVNRLGEFVGEEVVACGLVIEDRVHHQVTGEPMKFLTLADWTGMIETELFAQTYKSYGLATVRYPVLEVTARVEPFENGRGFTLRVLRAGKPRLRI